eukprot:CAMPEP_0185763508 /NCGR_PEP_ID=MMETSP1174-20130828/22448_1 /TAXON_ID=35687 /ORGANISM="Dictyocha speculum, Strain CCMP1381" /LENGTH=108 /DNA_ID=CAMNT_0028445659 /DNA_START=24 /DNA_END=347 /DNA_ORIENTATION=+
MTVNELADDLPHHIPGLELRKQPVNISGTQFLETYRDGHHGPIVFQVGFFHAAALIDHMIVDPFEDYPLEFCMANLIRCSDWCDPNIEDIVITVHRAVYITKNGSKEK